jgi:hypothetical protein
MLIISIQNRVIMLQTQKKVETPCIIWTQPTTYHMFGCRNAYKIFLWKLLRRRGRPRRRRFQDNIKKYLSQTACDDVKFSLNSGPIILSTPKIKLRKRYKSYCCEYNIFNIRILIHIKSVHDAVTVTVIMSLLGVVSHKTLHSQWPFLIYCAFPI